MQFTRLRPREDSVFKNKRGFTLIEFLIVVAVIVTVAAIIVPSFVQKSNGKARPTENEVLTKTVVDAIRGERVDVENLLHVNDHLRGGSNDLNAKLRAAGVTDKQIEILRSAHFRVSLEP